MVSSEQELLASARDLDLDALGEIYDTYSPEIFKHAMKVLGDENLAEDCVSETFTRLLLSFSKGKGPREFLRAYLYKIAHNWMTDFFRKQPGRIQSLDDSYTNGNELLPELYTELQLEKRTLRIALGQLTQDQREVITLRYLEGWSTEEISKVTRRPQGAVKALQHRGLISMKRILERVEKERVS